VVSEIAMEPLGVHRAGNQPKPIDKGRFNNHDFSKIDVFKRLNG
jgi:hypothetical protein